MSIQPEQKKMYRILAQSEKLTVTMFPKVATTIAESEETANEHIKLPTKPYVLQEICTEEEWNEGYPKFCPRCGSKAYFDSEGFYDCDDCEVHGCVTVEF